MINYLEMNHRSSSLIQNFVYFPVYDMNLFVPVRYLHLIIFSDSFSYS